jgi:hypothetical protein
LIGFPNYSTYKVIKPKTMSLVKTQLNNYSARFHNGTKFPVIVDAWTIKRSLASYGNGPLVMPGETKIIWANVDEWHLTRMGVPDAEKTWSAFKSSIPVGNVFPYELGKFFTYRSTASKTYKNTLDNELNYMGRIMESEWVASYFDISHDGMTFTLLQKSMAVQKAYIAKKNMAKLDAKNLRKLEKKTLRNAGKRQTRLGRRNAMKLRMEMSERKKTLKPFRDNLRWAKWEERLIDSELTQIYQKLRETVDFVRGNDMYDPETIQTFAHYDDGRLLMITTQDELRVANQNVEEAQRELALADKW